MDDEEHKEPVIERRRARKIKEKAEEPVIERRRARKIKGEKRRWTVEGWNLPKLRVFRKSGREVLSFSFLILL